MPGCRPFLQWQTSEHQKHNDSSQFSIFLCNTFCPIQVKTLCCRLKSWANPSPVHVCSFCIVQVIYDRYSVLELMTKATCLLPLSYLRRTSYSTFHFYLNSRHRLSHICSWVRGSHEWFSFRNVSDSSSPLVLFRVFSMRCLKGWGSSWNAVSIPLLLLPVILSWPPFKCQFYLGLEDCF